jgi:hypothetical protein
MATKIEIFVAPPQGKSVVNPFVLFLSKRKKGFDVVLLQLAGERSLVSRLVHPFQLHILLLKGNFVEK